ncbi:hypothetical protein QL285_007935 [Trifolium repens]|nr:hypothetical protein QL285_007935 [Trifolium repens]
MAYAQGFTLTLKLGFVFSSQISPKQRYPFVFPSSKCGFSLKFNYESVKFQNPLFISAKLISIKRRTKSVELMVAIMCSWVKKLIQEQHGVGDVVDLVDMDCVGLRPGFSMIENLRWLFFSIDTQE